MRVSGRGNGREEWLKKKKKKKKVKPSCHCCCQRPRSHYCPNQKVGSQKISKKVKPQPEEPKNVMQFLSRTTEIHKYVKINTVDQISFLARIVR